MFRLLFAATILAAASPAAAQTDPHAGHTGMQQTAPARPGIVTSPADGAMLNAAPTQFSLTFSHPMTLKSLSITPEGAPAMTVAVPGASPSADVSVTLPTLAPGTYAAAWAGVGEDGHEMSGVVRFMVH